MAVYRGCEFPEDLLFDVERDVWVRRAADGLVTLGMTDPAQARCGKLVFVRMKAPGRQVERGKSLATIESAKWVGPLPAPLSGEIVETNARGFQRDVLSANKDPYGRGWLIRLRPTRLAEELPDLLPAQQAAEVYRTKLDALQLHCYRCVEGDEQDANR